MIGVRLKELLVASRVVPKINGVDGKGKTPITVRDKLNDANAKKTNK